LNNSKEEKAMANQTNSDPQQDQKKSKAQAVVPEPNVQFIGRDKNGELDTSKALVNITTGADTRIKLPPREEQKKPFYLDPEKAERLCTEYKFLYKPFRLEKNSK